MSKHRLATHLVPCLGIFLASAQGLAQCTPAWDNVFAARGVIGNGVNAACVWDDGSGPAVYLGGDFSIIGNITTSGFPVPNTTGAHSIVKVVPTASGGYATLAAGIGPMQPAQNGVSIGGQRVIRAMVPFDPDGPGPAPSTLIVAGSFRWATASGTGTSSQRRNIASWNGTAWAALGDPSAPGLEISSLDDLRLLYSVRALAVYDPDGDGPRNPELFAGGGFSSAEFVTTYGIARWNGSSWSDVGGSPGSELNIVHALVVADHDASGPQPPVLYAAGDLTVMGDGSVVDGIAKWDGSAWSPLAGIASVQDYKLLGEHGIYALGVEHTLTGDRLWAGGNLIVNAQPCAVARMDEEGAWTCVFSDGDAFAGTIAPDTNNPHYTTSQRFAQFNGEMYFLGPRVPGLTPPGCAAGPYSAGLYKWNPATSAVSPVADIVPLHHPLDGLGIGETLNVATMMPLDVDLAGSSPEQLFIGGNFSLVGGAPCYDMCLYDGTSFKAFHPHNPLANGLGGYPGQEDGNRLAIFDPDASGPQPDSLIVAGRFSTAGGVLSPNVARFDGVNFHAMPFDPSASPNCVNPTFDGAPTILDFAAFPSGSSEQLFAASTTGVLRWDGAAWQMFAATANGQLVDKLELVNAPTGTELWAIGRFSSIAGVAANGAAMWNGSVWAAVDTGFGVAAVPTTAVTNSTGVFDFGAGPRVFAAGTDYTNDEALGEPFFDIWDGSQWVSMIDNLAFGSLQGTVYDAAVFQGRLFLAGSFTQINGAPSASKVIGWNGTAWFDTGSVSAINGYRLAVHDDGSGEALYVSGTGSTATVQKWNGSSAWTALPLTGSINSVESLRSFDDGSGPALYVAHAGVLVNGKQSIGLARYKTPCPACKADFNHAGGVTVQDIFDFLAAWFSGLPGADINSAGGVTVQDIFDFLALWFAGC